jgi:hypothetical protein
MDQASASWMFTLLLRMCTRLFEMSPATSSVALNKCSIATARQ